MQRKGYLSALAFCCLMTTACTNMVKQAELGECLIHRAEVGVYRVVKKSDEELILEQLLNGPSENSNFGQPTATSTTRRGPLKVINRYYGGWQKTSCP